MNVDYFPMTEAKEWAIGSLERPAILLSASWAASKAIYSSWSPVAPLTPIAPITLLKKYII